MKPKEKFNLGKLKEIPKNQLLIGGLLGILLLVIAIPVDSGKKQGAQGSQEETAENQEEMAGTQRKSGSSQNTVYEKQLEQRLTEVLEAMDGVGKAEVMITLRDGGESVVEKDVTKSSQKTEEEGGGTFQQQSQEETVFSSQQSSEQQPFVSKEVTPQIEGVLVVAKGGGNPTVAKNISDAVLALFPVEAHKIKVVKMNL